MEVVGTLFIENIKGQDLQALYINSTINDLY